MTNIRLLIGKIIVSTFLNMSWLVVEPYPSEKYEGQLGCIPNIWKNENMFQAISQIFPLNQCWECLDDPLHLGSLGP